MIKRWDSVHISLLSLNNWFDTFLPDHEGGELVFEADESHQSFGLEHELGVGVLHLGSRLHQALPITSGERWNLVIFLFNNSHNCPAVVAWFVKASVFIQ